MSAAFSSPLRKLTALLLLMATIAAAYLLVAEPLVARIGELEDRLQAERLLLGRLRAIEATAKQPQDAGPAGTGETLKSSIGDVFLSGESAGVMAARVQESLQMMARANNMNVASMRTVGIRQNDGLSLVGIEAEVEGGLAGLQKMLLTMEASRPVLLVDTMQVTPASNAVARKGPSNGEPSLNVRLLVFGASRDRLGDN